MSQFFRKKGGDSPAKPAGNEELECGHGSSSPQKPTAGRYQSSPSMVYLSETQSIHASEVPQTPTTGREYISHVQYNGQYGSAAQVPLTPSGPSRVVGYLPRTIYSDSSPFFSPTSLIMPSQLFRNPSNRDIMSNSGPQRRSTSISSIASHRSPSPRSPFDPSKHGQALRRLETHGSLKTIPSGQQEDDALNRTSISWSEFGRELFVEDHTAEFGDSLPQQPGSRTTADSYEQADQRSGIDHSSPLIQYLPNSVYQPEMLSQGDSSRVIEMHEPLKIEGDQGLRGNLPSFVFPLPIADADDPNQVIHLALHQSHVPSEPHQALSSKSLSGKPIATNPLPNSWSNSTSSEGMPERVLDIQSIGNSAHTFIQSPTFEKMDEYLWSPAQSDDEQEAPSGPHTQIPRHAPSDDLHASPISGHTSASHDGFSQSSEPYGNDHIHSRSGSSNYPCVTDSPLPHIDVLIPAGAFNLDSHSDLLSSSQHASNAGSKESSSVLYRYSGVITDGASSRPMSEIELKEEVLHSLGDQAKTGLSMPNSKDLSSQADRHIHLEQIRGEHDPNARREAFPLNRVHSPSADAGPGSSQTSSSLSTGRYDGNQSDHKACLGNHCLPSSRTRCPTPPLLFGRHAISAPEDSKTMSTPALGHTISRFDQHAKVIRLNETGRLPTPLCSLGEQDWETISAETEVNTHTSNGIVFDTKTGSSLADNSDSGSLSLSKETSYPFRGSQARPVMQHPGHPRHNHSFVLLNNSQTGDLVQVPQYEYASGGRLPNNNASTQLVSRVRADNTYQHPSPLRIEHNHPFSSSPPVVRLAKPSATRVEESCNFIEPNRLSSELSSSGLSAGVREVKEKQTQNSLYKKNQNLSRVRDPAVAKNQYVMDSKEQSHQSSAWLSTVSEVASSELSLPGNGATFTNMVVWDGEGHVNVTPERGANREVGSSLADASSPGANFSSSSAPLANSPIQVSDTPPSLGQSFHRQIIGHDLDHGSQHLLGDFHQSLARSFNRKDSATSTTNTENRSRSHSASGPRPMHRKPSPRRRRSSSESHSSLMDSPSAQKASALYSSSLDGYAQQTTSSGLLLRNPFSHPDDDESQYNLNQHNVLERRLRQPKADDASVDDPTTSSSSGSRPFVRDGVVHTDSAPPILDHPVYGRDRPWDLIRPIHPRPRPHPNPLRRPLFQRPVARAESPHLHRIPHPPTPELLERHVLISRIYLVLFSVFPPMGIIYGHGYMDGIMRFHTRGEINGFRNTEKTIALCSGYGLSAMCILAIVIAMIIISASK